MGLFDFIDSTAPGKKNRQNVSASTQTYLRIAEIRDNVVVLKNGGLRSVLKTSSINFNLKSEDEQNAIIYSYQGFLNSLEFPIQISIRSKKIDIDDYVDQVKEMAGKQTNQLLQNQTYEYAEYVKRLVEYADIMEKEFYVIVPYDPGGEDKQSKFQGFFQRMAPRDTVSEIKKRHSAFKQLKRKLTQRVNVVKSGLENCGLRVKELETYELINLYYKTYNPLTSRNDKLKNLKLTNIETDEEKIENEKKLKKEINKEEKNKEK